MVYSGHHLRLGKYARRWPTVIRPFVFSGNDDTSNIQRRTVHPELDRSSLVRGCSRYGDWWNVRRFPDPIRPTAFRSQTDYLRVRYPSHSLHTVSYTHLTLPTNREV